MIRSFLIFVLSTLIIACSGHSPTSPEETTRQFYQQYLQAMADFDPVKAEQSPTADNSSLIQQYVAADTAKRIANIHALYEQDILESDYFSYSQDYAAEWVKAFKVGKASPFIGGVIVPVSLETGNNSFVLLDVYLRREAGTWKIYRVVDKTDNVEQPIFDAGRFNAAIEHSRMMTAAEK